MIKAVIFDLDGTLLDRDSSIHKFILEQYERLENKLGHIGQAEYASRFIELEKNGYVWKDEVYLQLVDEFDIQGISWQELLDDYLAQFPKHCIPFPGVVPLLEELKGSGIRLGMITNGFTDFQAGNIRALGIEPYFDEILISEREGLRKPDRRIFERALKRLGVAAKEAIFVGDHPLNDVEAASLAGMVSVWKRNSQWEEAAADFIINDLGEIPGGIRRRFRLES